MSIIIALLSNDNKKTNNYQEFNYVKCERVNKSH